MTAFIPIAIEAAEGAGAAEGAEAGEAAEGEEGLGQTHDLGNGNKMFLSDEQFRALLHSKECVDAIHDRAKMVWDNTDRLRTKKNAKYEILIQNTDSSTRARAFVKPANADGYYDDLAYSTLAKSMVGVPSDPRPETSTGDEQPQENHRNPGEEADAGASEGAEAGFAEGAEIALI